MQNNCGRVKLNGTAGLLDAALGAEKQRLSLYYAQCVEFYRYFARFHPTERSHSAGFFLQEASKLRARGAIAVVLFYILRLFQLRRMNQKNKSTHFTAIFASYGSFLQIVLVAEYTG